MKNRKTQIVDLALQLIREKGYVAISYDDLSKQLGVTKASIHYHFEKKEDLGLALMGKVQENLEQFLKLIKSSVMTVEEKLTLYFERQYAPLSSDEICPISSLQSDFASLPDVIRVKVQELSEFEIKVITTILTDEQGTKPANQSKDIEAVVYTVLSCLKGALQYKRALGKDVLSLVQTQINRLVKS
ncbi:TetR/AcrR family transcriptional regulator [Paenibacillus sp. WC2504]|uniref:TetR/AcrR family transcriptional regulator n=1 Tax=Paenibacillus sp. WC2504 TaxID=3461403 RepID=UPI004045B83F